METEQNYIETDINTEADTTGSFILLNGCTTGTTATTRVGAEIRMTSLHLRLQFLSDQDFASGARYIVLLDHQTNGAAPTAAQILTDTNCVGLKNQINRSRFTFLLDETVVVAGHERDTPLKYTNNKMTFEVAIPTIYNSGAAGTVADIQTNSLYLFLTGNIANPNGVPVIGKARVKFIE